MEKEDEINIINDEEIPILKALNNYSNENIACFDVPGHVRDRGVEILNKYFGDNVMRMDINSSPRMDNISNPYGIIKEAEEKLAEAYNADKGFFITNGTTGAIQAMILSVINPGDKILLPRNIHKSVINALILSGGEPIFIQPEFDESLGISLNLDINKIKVILKNEEIKAIFLLNPTYYGACSDLREVVKLCHGKGVLVLVDEAHGAHFHFNDKLPLSAMDVGADMSAISVHKTGGALTQASALLVKTKNIDSKKVKQSINMIQSTSASYLLMGSIDGARFNLEVNGQYQLENALNIARFARYKLNKIDGVKALSSEILGNTGVYSVDETKICINFKELNLTGFEVYDILYKEFNIQAELGDLYNILVLISIGTVKEDVNRLVDAIKIISKRYKKDKDLRLVKINQIQPKLQMTPREAFYSKKESVSIKDSIGRVCGESIMAYPPGIPIIAPGEVVTREIIQYIKLLKESNAYLTDMKDSSLESVLVIENK